MLVQGLANSRNQAQQLIEAGLVFTTESGTEQPVKKSSQKVSDPSALTVREGAIQRFVSRGGLKLEGALERTKHPVAGALALDVGISTGGFTDCLLKKGAVKVIGVDVGHDQLASSLKNDARVICLEGINARELSSATLLAATASSGENMAFDIIVVDHFLWHQHFNDDPTKTAKVVRIHMFDSLLETMRVLMDPMVLFEEPPDAVRDAQAGDYSTIEWPELQRPTWP